MHRANRGIFPSLLWMHETALYLPFKDVYSSQWRGKCSSVSTAPYQHLLLTCSSDNHFFLSSSFYGQLVVSKSVQVSVLNSWLRQVNQTVLGLVSNNIRNDFGLWFVLSNAVCLFLSIHNFFDSSMLFRVGDIECFVSQIGHITQWLFEHSFFALKCRESLKLV